jgi:hypothetical protein
MWATSQPQYWKYLRSRGSAYSRDLHSEREVLHRAPPTLLPAPHPPARPHQPALTRSATRSCDFASALTSTGRGRCGRTAKPISDRDPPTNISPGVDRWPAAHTSKEADCRNKRQPTPSAMRHSLTFLPGFHFLHLDWFSCVEIENVSGLFVTEVRDCANPKGPRRPGEPAEIGGLVILLNRCHLNLGLRDPHHGGPISTEFRRIWLQSPRSVTPLAVVRVPAESDRAIPRRT